MIMMMMMLPSDLFISKFIFFFSVLTKCVVVSCRSTVRRLEDWNFLSELTRMSALCAAQSLRLGQASVHLSAVLCPLQPDNVFAGWVVFTSMSSLNGSTYLSLFYLTAASLLGFACSVDEQCTLKVPNSVCTDGLCQCKSNFLPLRRDKCLPRKSLNISTLYLLKHQQGTF